MQIKKSFFEVLEANSENEDIALIAGAEQLSYRELVRRSKQIGRALVKSGVQKGDRILLCSDGLYDEVDDDTILSVLNRYDDMKVCAEDLVYMANENGGNDNISVICVDLED